MSVLIFPTVIYHVVLSVCGIIESPVSRLSPACQLVVFSHSPIIQNNLYRAGERRGWERTLKEEIVNKLPCLNVLHLDDGCVSVLGDETNTMIIIMIYGARPQNNYLHGRFIGLKGSKR